ncbi:LacI family DNA-binding transcriptional regulator [Alloscardovia criceti]|uniref:LacI family DNA-binding transcriptional regulator n=1 Tax=Alloscardovia criceti TaxID=356828 RepID=UPI000361F98A|nr:LacI family DNA-binding transcriptional regulator [Alloscardovia criceti]
MVTIQDVAKEAGVSKATVSYVLADSPLISEKTANRVRKAMKKLGYSVNHAARVLSTKQTKTIGIVAPDHRGERFSLSFGAYLYSIGHAASSLGYDTLLLIGDNDVESMKSAIRERKVDGLILMDIHDDDQRVNAIRNKKFPVVLLGSTTNNQGLNVIDTNFEQAATSIIEHVHSRGHKEILLITWPEEMYKAHLNFVTRFHNTTIKSAQEKNITLHVLKAQADTFGTFNEIRNALETNPDITCIVVHNDAAVISLPQELTSIGISVPQDLSVVCIVPDQMGIGMHIPYTAVEVDIDKVALDTVNLLITHMNNADLAPEQIFIDQPLVDNGSVTSIHR